jgi:hypothetical protein
VVIELGGAEHVQSHAVDIFDRVTVTDARGAIAAIADDHAVSVVIVDDTDGSGAGNVLEALVDAEPSLPIVLVSHAKDARARLSLAPDVDAATLRRAVSEIPEVQAYAPNLVEAFADAVVGGINDGFLRGASVAGAFYKSNRRQLADVSGLLKFEGGAFSGWVVIAADHTTLRSMFEAMFDDAKVTDHELEDLAGEMSNHVVARLRRWLPDSRPRIVSVPEIMLGRAELMPKTRARHTLTLEVTTPEGPLFAQLHFDAKDPIEVSAVPHGHEAFQML